MNEKFQRKDKGTFLCSNVFFYVNVLDVLVVAPYITTFFFFTFYKSKNILGLSEMCINYYILIKRLQGQFFFGIICTTESFTVRRELKG